MLKTLLIGKLMGPIIRHGATAFGGFMVAQGWADEAMSQEIIGAVVTLGGLAMSVAEKEIR